jgi:hypothetical protein
MGNRDSVGPAFVSVCTRAAHYPVVPLPGCWFLQPVRAQIGTKHPILHAK